jgi:hypothetical protein
MRMRLATRPKTTRLFRDLGASEDVIEALQKASGRITPATQAAGTQPTAPAVLVVAAGSSGNGRDSSAVTTAPGSVRSSQHAGKNKLKDKYCVRMAELVVTATSIENEPVSGRAGPPHRDFAVRNLSSARLGAQGSSGLAAPRANTERG